MCADALSEMGFPADVSRRIVARPDIAVTFEVEEIFMQLCLAPVEPRIHECTVL